MPSLQVKVDEEVLTPTQKTEIGGSLNDDTASINGADAGTLNWTDIEQAIADGWEIGGPSMTTDAIRGLVADE